MLVLIEWCRKDELSTRNVIRAVDQATNFTLTWGRNLKDLKPEKGIRFKNGYVEFERIVSNYAVCQPFEKKETFRYFKRIENVLKRVAVPQETKSLTEFVEAFEDSFLTDLQYKNNLHALHVSASDKAHYLFSITTKDMSSFTFEVAASLRYLPRLLMPEEISWGAVVQTIQPVFQRVAGFQHSFGVVFQENKLVFVGSEHTLVCDDGPCRKYPNGRKIELCLDTGCIVFESGSCIVFGKSGSSENFYGYEIYILKDSRNILI